MEPVAVALEWCVMGLASMLGFGGPLTKADRKRWADARTLPDLGELTALWLEGRIESRPGYYGRVDVDEHLAPGMTKALVACNRAGFVTHNSEGGVVTSRYQQHAWVFGFATPAVYNHLRRGLGRGLQSCAWPMRRGWAARKPPGDFGKVYEQLGKRELGSQWHGCSADAWQALTSALQVTFYDPEPGRNTLWGDLERAARRWRR